MHDLAFFFARKKKTITAITPALTNPTQMPIPDTAEVESFEGLGVGEGKKVLIGVKRELRLMISL